MFSQRKTAARLARAPGQRRAPFTKLRMSVRHSTQLLRALLVLTNAEVSR
ncbi:hypothetical protein [Streptomyces sp. NPDC057072]